MKDTMSIHAFVDESRRGSRYYVAVALVEPRHLRELRRDVRNLLLPGQREIHFKKEKDPRRRALADSFARLPVEVNIYSQTCRRHDETARQACLRTAVELLGHRISRLVIDSRSHRDVIDSTTLSRIDHTFIYEHMSTGEPLLWIADVVAWCYGAGSEWRKRIAPIVSGEVDLDGL
ncbi:hypothetical protein [Alloactinosynnema sp. L-07]|uniref:DUF3800 domain-containing protein n=1 Tax=Alloactinosynnema sp. L-07 TaxID=1653480 RepID=UPI001E48DA03|nr:hypothetical protein [Alloactinosynnema sp. L-07]